MRQLSVFIANEAGRVSEVTGLLGESGVNIRGFSVSDTADYGILRLVVDKPDAGARRAQEARDSRSRRTTSSASICPTCQAVLRAC